MTDAPKTLSLDSSEWRALLQSNLVRAHEFTQSNANLTIEAVHAFHQHLDRMKALVVAWHTSQMPVAKVEQPVTNGAAEPKRKPGWPKGKPRKRMNPAQAVQ